MEITIQDKGRISLGRAITQANFEIFSTDKLYNYQIKGLAQSLFMGQDTNYQEVEINIETSLPYKWRYIVKIVNDSSD